MNISVLSLLPVLGLLSCDALNTNLRKNEIDEGQFSAKDPSVHLVMDLGSSGTRFCLYRVLHRADGRGCRLAPSRPVCSRVSGGLAKLSRGHRVNHIAGLIEPHLRNGWSLLGNARLGGDLELRSQVRAAVALGTGGFRDTATGQPISHPEWQTLFAEVERFLRRETGNANVVARAMTGEEEGRLAWLGLAQGEHRPAEFAAIEAGGATVQLAVGKISGLQAAVEVATDPHGQDVVFEQFVSRLGPRKKEFQVCFNPLYPRKQNGPKCIELLGREVFRDSAVRRLAEKTSARRLFGLGLSFAEQFRAYPAAPPWPIKNDRMVHEKLAIDSLSQLTKLLCPLTDTEIRAYAPNTLAIQRSPTSNPGRACYYLAYRAALLMAIRKVAARSAIYSAEEDQWPRGAAVSGDLFKDCE